MKPGLFDPFTAREFIGDERARVIELTARGDAERGAIALHEADPVNYADGVRLAMERVIYLEQYNKRRARISRVAAKSSSLPVRG